MKIGKVKYLENIDDVLFILTDEFANSDPLFRADILRDLMFLVKEEYNLARVQLGWNEI